VKTSVRVNIDHPLILAGEQVFQRGGR
jgi:hypothetical protein